MLVLVAGAYADSNAIGLLVTVTFEAQPVP